MVYLNSTYIKKKDADTLYNLCLELCKKFNTPSPDVFEISKRLITADGNYSINYYKAENNKTFEYTKLVLSYKHYINFGYESLEKVLRHEIAHNIEYHRNQNFSHNKDFKELCFLLGGCLNKKLAIGKYKKCDTQNYNVNVYTYKYLCPNCHSVYYTRRKINKNFICNKCCIHSDNFLMQKKK